MFFKSKRDISKYLKTRQASGEELNEGELYFLKEFPATLTQYGLQINANGDLEDIPVSKNRRGRR